jgi:endonuclease/exonuclease/phosphatase family metal-dependent hydrolase
MRKNPYKPDDAHVQFRVKLGQCALSIFVIFAFVMLVRLSNSPSLSIMTFNLRYASANDGLNSWDYRKEHCIDIINRYHPTVLGTQEGLRDQLAEIQMKLKHNYQRFGVERQPNGEYVQIFFDADVLEGLDGGNYWLSSNPNVPHQADWGTSVVRMVTWFHFRIRATHQQFVIVNTHFDHKSQLSRDNSAKLIWKHIQQKIDPSIPVFVIGDFNTFRHTSVYSYLTTEAGANFADAWKVADKTIGDVSHTYHGFRGLAFKKELGAIRAANHMDWILFRPRDLKVLTAEVVTESRNGRYPSDHYPVYVTVKFP